jgi:Rhodopirellula transposase DDE domain
MDAKATVKVGNFSRGGKKRVQVKAADHDFAASAKVTPVGILLPQFDEVFLACVTSKVTSDCLVDVLELWWQRARERYCQVRTLVINLDNGKDESKPSDPISQAACGLCSDDSTHHPVGLLSTVSRASYNPVERCWGILEKHWNGDVLDTIETVVQFAQTMTWKGNTPMVHLLTTLYHTGVRLTKQAMAQVETSLERLNGLERWFLKISCAPFLSPDT